MDISSGVTDYLKEILKEIKNHLHLISINQSSNKKARDTAKKLHKNIEKQFQFKETMAFFIQMDEKLTDFQSKTYSLKRSNESNEGTKTAEIKRPCIQKDATFEFLTKERNFNVRESLIIWKLRNNPPCDDLAYYDILDLTPGSNSDFVKNYLPTEIYNRLMCEQKLRQKEYNEIKHYII
ncbi:22483_t:CDS:2 [Gigaspora margarita]|uniref:22483_t:CDS:1 n=1 Tax=Gigaspora margarita TaxID=4874 RepID=A0ABN7W0B9_GIGMA|nr:22483_t:CDS:2 [Gigaspora margarita]